MSDVEQVALWVGLLSGTVSIVLSVVAIVFAVMVDRSARAVTAQTIKSLQKIESDVERLSSDTRDLIKAGWDRMLGSVPFTHPPKSTAPSELAAGIAAELKAEFAPLIQSTDKAKQNILERRLDDVIETLESSLTLPPRSDPRMDRRSIVVDRLRAKLEALSPEAIALAAGVISGHLDSKQYRELRDGPLGPAVRELRRAGLLAPHVAFGKSDNDPPVYFFPGRMARTLRSALPLVPPPGQGAEDLVKSELERVGYSSSAA